MEFFDRYKSERQVCKRDWLRVESPILLSLKKGEATLLSLTVQSRPALEE